MQFKMEITLPRAEIDQQIPFVRINDKKRYIPGHLESTMWLFQRDVLREGPNCNSKMAVRHGQSGFRKAIGILFTVCLLKTVGADVERPLPGLGRFGKAHFEKSQGDEER